MAAKHKSKQKSKSNRQPFSGGRRQFLSGVSITMVGVGSLARPFAELAVRRGADHFRLIDLKRYKPASVENQCLPNEVGQLKVDAVGQRLEELGARVETFPVDVFRVPDGVVEPGGVVISSVDNWRGFIGANRLAMRMNARLLKLNVEPKLHCAAVRAYSLAQGHRCAAKTRWMTVTTPISCTLAAATLRLQVAVRPVLRSFAKRPHAWGWSPCIVWSPATRKTGTAGSGSTCRIQAESCNPSWFPTPIAAVTMRSVGTTCHGCPVNPPI